MIGSLLLSQCGDGGDGGDFGTSGSSAGTGSSASTSPESGSTSPSGSSTASPSDGGASGQPGTITAGDTSVLPLTAGADSAPALAQVSGRPAQGSAVQVLAVPADEGFWVGTSDTERIWVQLTGSGESPYQVQEGDTVDFQGTVVAHSSGFAQQVGLEEAEGAAQLDAQGHHLEVDKTSVTLAD
ncbi:hypothetical protein [Blastococcus sp. TF02-8]|uniref:hypothetical protein n=1 Tax=Blastococcus sp. TF02-8 TaxID=2250574 RepID=UPI000DE847C3|nr:hypothetical protein [Blastococcus sp. TF02-8]